MILIKSVHVVGFRSLENCRLDKLGHFHGLVGKNSCGKSNFLRALNLFFNDEVENGRSLSFDTDYFAKPQRKQKRRISIKVEFELPSAFKFRKQQSYLAELGARFSIERAWELGQRRNVGVTYGINSGGKSVSNAEELAPQFLQLITFRYIPNRSVPADILRSESQTLATSLVRRMNDQNPGQELISQLSGAAGRLLAGATKELKACGAPLASPQVATAELSQMLSMSGFQAKAPNGGFVQDDNWGAGHQAFFLYQVLHALDTDYRRYFGWRQATIWAVEEPESALHRDLESRLAMLIRGWALDSANRLQVLMTTHSPVFAMAADGGDWIQLGARATEARSLTVTELVRAAETEGVSGWTQPLLSHPFSPVVLVEGPIDAAVMSHVAAISGREDIRFLSLPSLDEGEEGGGKDAIVAHLKRHSSLIPHRLPEAPLVVLFDWDVTDDELSKARRTYGTGANDRVLRMSVAHAVSELGPDWKGIERFYPLRVIHEADRADEISVAISPTRGTTVSPIELRRGKGALRRRVLEVNSPADFSALRNVLRDVANAIDSSARI
jgi:energy-coupling factor transporter ATP-binding protein EcfA2